MYLFSLLNTAIDISLLEQGYQIGLDWLGQFARIIIEGVGITGLGIIVFNLVLKAITLPFDIYQRVSSRKQNLVMEQMQPELEKLQKQYANDKTTYNQKMLELQKKNGYSMLGACLPMIVSLVILIVAWQGFRAYSQYANLSYFENMSKSYNEAIGQYSVVGTDYTLQEEEGSYFVVWQEEGEKKLPITWKDGEDLPVEGDVIYTMTDVPSESGPSRKYLTVKSKEEKNYVFYYYNMETTPIAKEYRVDLDRLYGVLSALSEEERGELGQAVFEAYQAYTAQPDDTSFNALRIAGQAYVVRIGADAAAERFREDDPSFLWIRNVWYPDVSYSHPIPSYSDFSGQLNVNVTFENGEQKPLSSVISQAQYENLTSQLTEEKSAPNGYFILIILSIGFMLLSQLIVMKSSKTSNQYQTVDGQGAKTQKIMLVVMPLIYAMFAFAYSAAFSIYMTMSSIVSILVTLIANFAIGRVFKKKEEAARVARYERKLPWMKDGEASKKGKKK